MLIPMDLSFLEHRSDEQTVQSLLLPTSVIRPVGNACAAPVIAALDTSKHISRRWILAECVSSRTRENCVAGDTLKCVVYMCRSANRERVSGYIVVGESLFVVSVNGRILRFHQERQRPVLTFQSLSTMSYYRQVRFDVTR